MITLQPLMLLLLAAYAKAQFIPLKAYNINNFSPRQPWNNFFAPANMQKSPWPQLRYTDRELKRYIKPKPSRPKLQNYKRWGPKYVIIENNKPKAGPYVRPELDKNAKILQYNPGIPEHISTYSVPYKEYENSGESQSLMSEDQYNIQKQNPYNQRDKTYNILNEKQSGYIPTDKYEMFMTTPTITLKRPKEISSITDEYEREVSVNKPTKSFALPYGNQAENLKGLTEKPRGIETNKRLMPLPNPEMQDLAAKFINTLQYKRYNALRYLKAKEDKVASMYKDVLEHGDDVNGALDEKNLDKLSAKEMIQFNKIVPQAEREALIQKYLRQQTVDSAFYRKAIDENLAAIRNNVVLQNKLKNARMRAKKLGTIPYLDDLRDRMDEPQYGTTPSVLKFNSHTVKANQRTAKHLDREEETKHGENPTGNFFAYRRPKLEIGVDFHGDKERELELRKKKAHEDEQNTRKVKAKGRSMEDTTAQESNFPEQLIGSGPKKPMVPAKGNAMASGKEKPDPPKAPLKAPNLLAGEDSPTPPQPLLLVATKPIVPKLDQPELTPASQPAVSPKSATNHVAPSAALPQAATKPAIPAVENKKLCMNCPKLLPHMKLVPLYMCCKQIGGQMLLDAVGGVRPSSQDNNGKPLVSADAAAPGSTQSNPETTGQEPVIDPTTGKPVAPDQNPGTSAVATTVPSGSALNPVQKPGIISGGEKKPGIHSVPSETPPAATGGNSVVQTEDGSVTVTTPDGKPVKTDGEDVPAVGGLKPAGQGGTQPKPGQEPGDKPVLPGDTPRQPGQTPPLKPGEKPVLPEETPAQSGENPLAPGEKPLIPDVGDAVKTPQEQMQQSFNGKGNTNPALPSKRPSAQPCSDNECEGGLMKDMKSKLKVLFDQLFMRGGNHQVEMYSTGCKGKDCSRALGSIKFDGMELGGGSEGMNIVVLGYPGYEFLFSKTYDTGQDAMESAKMAQFLAGLKPTSVIMIVAQGDATTAMTEEAWDALAKLTCRSSFIKTPGSSFAFLGYNGDVVFPWSQVNQRASGDGASAIYTIIGSDTEYISFGGSGQTLTNLVKNILANEAPAATREHQLDTKIPLYQTASEPSVILTNTASKTKLEKEEETANDNDHKKTRFDAPASHYAVKSTSRVPVEPDAENEPQNPLITQAPKLKKITAAFTRKRPGNEEDLGDVPSTSALHKIMKNFASQKPQNKQQDEKEETAAASVGNVQVIVENESTFKNQQNFTKHLESSEELLSHDHAAAIDRDFEAGLADTKEESKEQQNEMVLDQTQKDQANNEDSTVARAVTPNNDTRPAKNKPQPGNHHPEQHAEDSEHHSEQMEHPPEHAEHHPEPTEHHPKPAEHHPEPEEHHAEPEEHHPGPVEHHVGPIKPYLELPIHPPPPVPVHHAEHLTDMAHHGEGLQPFVGHIINTGYVNHPMIPVTQLYRSTSADITGHSGAQYYVPSHEHHTPYQESASTEPGPHMIGHGTEPGVAISGHDLEAHAAFEDDHHGSVLAVRPTLSLHEMHGPHEFTHGGSDDHFMPHNFHHEHGYSDSQYSHENHMPVHYEEHKIPVLNVPHPYVIQASSPIEPHHEEPVEEPHHENTPVEPHHEKPKPEEKEKEKPKHETDTEKKTPAPMTPEFQAKLKEMLAEELTKKLQEMKLTPSGKLAPMSNTIDNKIVLEGVPLKPEKTSEKGITGLTDSAAVNKNENSQTADTREHDSLTSQGTHDSHDNVNLNKFEHFVHGDADDFNYNEEAPVNIKHTTNRNPVSDVKVESAKTNKQVGFTARLNKPLVRPSTTLKSRNVSLISNGSTIRANKTKAFPTKHETELINAGEKFVNVVKNKSNDNKSSAKEPIIHNGPGLENSETAQSKNLVDNQEELPEEEPKNKPLTDTKDPIHAVDGMSDTSEISSEFIEGKGIKDETSVSDRTTDISSKVGSSLCKRYRVLKNGEKIKLKLKKGCVEKVAGKLGRKGRLQPLPDTSETVTALSMNPGYSTLPGAESRPAGQQEVSYYFDSKNKDMPPFRDGVYSDVSSSNIYDQGDYVNAAEQLLQKDVRDAYNTANDIITAEEVLDKSKNARKRKTIMYKRTRNGKEHHDRRRHKPERPARKSYTSHKSRSNLDHELERESFQW